MPRKRRESYHKRTKKKKLKAREARRLRALEQSNSMQHEVDDATFTGFVQHTHNVIQGDMIIYTLVVNSCDRATQLKSVEQQNMDITPIGIKKKHDNDVVSNGVAFGEDNQHFGGRLELECDGETITTKSEPVENEADSFKHTEIQDTKHCYGNLEMNSGDESKFSEATSVINIAPILDHKSDSDADECDDCQVTSHTKGRINCGKRIKLELLESVDATSSIPDVKCAVLEKSSTSDPLGSTSANGKPSDFQVNSHTEGLNSGKRIKLELLESDDTTSSIPDHPHLIEQVKSSCICQECGKECVSQDELKGHVAKCNCSPFKEQPSVGKVKRIPDQKVSMVKEVAQQHLQRANTVKEVPQLAQQHLQRASMVIKVPRKHSQRANTVKEVPQLAQQHLQRASMVIEVPQKHGQRTSTVKEEPQKHSQKTSTVKKAPKEHGVHEQRLCQGLFSALHTCPFCEQQFFCRENLDKHKKAIHYGKSRHPCLICDGTLPLGQLKEHIKQVHRCRNGVVPEGLSTRVMTYSSETKSSLICSICGTIRFSLNEMLGHVQLHTNSEFSCHYCGKEYAQQGHLSYHYSKEPSHYPAHMEISHPLFVEHL